MLMSLSPKYRSLPLVVAVTSVWLAWPCASRVAHADTNQVASQCYVGEDFVDWQLADQETQSRTGWIRAETTAGDWIDNIEVTLASPRTGAFDLDDDFPTGCLDNRDALMAEYANDPENPQPLSFSHKEVPVWALRGLAKIHRAEVAVFRTNAINSCEGGYIIVTTKDEDKLSYEHPLIKAVIDQDANAHLELHIRFQDDALPFPTRADIEFLSELAANNGERSSWMVSADGKYKYEIDIEDCGEWLKTGEVGSEAISANNEKLLLNVLSTHGMPLHLSVIEWIQSIARSDAMAGVQITQEDAQEFIGLSLQLVTAFIEPSTNAYGLPDPSRFWELWVGAGAIAGIFGKGAKGSSKLGKTWDKLTKTKIGRRIAIGAGKPITLQDIERATVKKKLVVYRWTNISPDQIKANGWDPTLNAKGPTESISSGLLNKETLRLKINNGAIRYMSTSTSSKKLSGQVRTGAYQYKIELDGTEKAIALKELGNLGHYNLGEVMIPAEALKGLKAKTTFVRQTEYKEFGIAPVLPSPEDPDYRLLAQCTAKEHVEPKLFDIDESTRTANLRIRHNDGPWSSNIPVKISAPRTGQFDLSPLPERCLPDLDQLPGYGSDPENPQPLSWSANAIPLWTSQALGVSHDAEIAVFETSGKDETTINGIRINGCPKGYVVVTTKHDDKIDINHQLIQGLLRHEPDAKLDLHTHFKEDAIAFPSVVDMRFLAALHQRNGQETSWIGAPDGSYKYEFGLAFTNHFHLDAWKSACADWDNVKPLDLIVLKAGDETTVTTGGIGTLARPRLPFVRLAAVSNGVVTGTTASGLGSGLVAPKLVIAPQITDVGSHMEIISSLTDLGLTTEVLMIPITVIPADKCPATSGSPETWSGKTVVGHWQFDAPSDETSLDVETLLGMDSSGSGHHGKVFAYNNGTNVVNGRLNRVSQDNGRTENALLSILETQCSDNADLALGRDDSFLISAWVWPAKDEMPADGAIVGNRRGGVGWELQLSNQLRPTLWLQGDSGFYQVYSAQESPKTVEPFYGWHHLAVSWHKTSDGNGYAAQLFLDGEPLTIEHEGSAPPEFRTSNRLVIGASAAAGYLSQDYWGAIDDVSIHRGNYSEQDVRQLFQHGLKPEVTDFEGDLELQMKQWVSLTAALIRDPSWIADEFENHKNQLLGWLSQYGKEDVFAAMGKVLDQDVQREIELAFAEVLDNEEVLSDEELANALPDQSCILIIPDNTWCSGDLVGPTQFLTAAHCVVGNYEPSEYSVACGFDPDTGKPNVRRGVEEIEKHELYNEVLKEMTVTSDVGLVTLTSPFEHYSTYIRVSTDKGDTERLITQRPCAMFGYGFDSEGKGGFRKAIPLVFDGAPQGLKESVRCGADRLLSFDAYLCWGVDSKGNKRAGDGDSGAGVICLDSDDTLVRVATLSQNEIASRTWVQSHWLNKALTSPLQPQQFAKADKDLVTWFHNQRFFTSRSVAKADVEAIFVVKVVDPVRTDENLGSVPGDGISPLLSFKGLSLFEYEQVAGYTVRRGHTIDGEKLIIDRVRI